MTSPPQTVLGENMSPFKWSGKTIITQAKIGTRTRRAKGFYLTVCPDQLCSAPSAGLKKQQGRDSDWSRRRRAVRRKRRKFESFPPPDPSVKDNM